MTILKSHSCDGTGTVTAAALGFNTSAGTVPTYESGNVFQGTRSLRFVTTQFGYLADTGFSGQICLSYYLYFPTLPPSNTNICQAVTSAGALIGRAQITSTGKLNLKNGSNVTTGSVSGIQPATWHRIEHLFTGSSTQRLRVFLGDDPVASQDTGPGIAATAGTPGQAWFGAATIPPAQFLLDAIQVGDTFTGPWTPTVSDRTGLMRVWNGSAWVHKPMKVWNGSAWVQKPVKYYNGADWVLAR